MVRCGREYRLSDAYCSTVPSGLGFFANYPVIKGGLPKLKDIEKRFAVGQIIFVNSWIIVNFHVAAAETAALRHLGNQPYIAGLFSAAPPGHV